MNSPSLKNMATSQDYIYARLQVSHNIFRAIFVIYCTLYFLFINQSVSNRPIPSKAKKSIIDITVVNSETALLNN